MKLFDSHCHLDDRTYDRDRKAVIRRAKKAGISGAMIIGTNLNRSKKAVGLV